MPAINQKSRIVPKVSMCPLDMLSQILYYKTQDVGKLCVVLIDSVQDYPLLINLCDELGVVSQNRPEFLAWAKKRLLITSMMACRL